jgi:hypothetical protein
VVVLAAMLAGVGLALGGCGVERGDAVEDFEVGA